MFKKIVNVFLAIAIIFTFVSEYNVNAQTTKQMDKVINVARDNNLNNDVNDNRNNVNDNIKNDVNDANNANRNNDWAWLGLLGLVGLLGLRRRPEKR